jgi:hypothetical protein
MPLMLQPDPVPAYDVMVLENGESLFSRRCIDERVFDCGLRRYSSGAHFITFG